MKKFILLFCVLVLMFGFAEERTVRVIGFDFLTAEVLLEDEDGFIWSCPFGENDWSLGEEYVLLLNDNCEIYEF